eukprot:787299-Pyramimonas_sp.AAC.1
MLVGAAVWSQLSDEATRAPPLYRPAFEDPLGVQGLRHQDGLSGTCEVHSAPRCSNRGVHGFKEVGDATH